MLPAYSPHGQRLPVLLTLVLLLQTLHSFSAESCLTESCRHSAGYLVPLGALFGCSVWVLCLCL